MLQSMRKYSRSFLAVLMFGFLVLTFAAWGIGDIFRNSGRDQTIAEVSGVKIQAADVRNQFNRDLEQLQSELGNKMTAEQAIAFNLHIRSAEQLVQQALRSKIMDDKGVLIDNALIRAQIANNPDYRDFSGKFDAGTFLRALQRAGLSEQGFVATLKRDIASQQLYGSMIGAVGVPVAYRDAIYRLRAEQRVIETLMVPLDVIKDVPAPNAEEFQRYYQANAKAFALPEYRKIKFVYVRPDDVKSEIKLSDAKLREEYEARKAEISKAETREVSQVVFESEDKAKAFVAAVKGGKGFEAAAKEITAKDKSVIDLGAVKKADLPAPLNDAAFALALNALSEPVKSPLGWHVLRVAKIDAGSTPSFEDSREQLIKSLQQQAAPDLLAKMALEFEKAIGKGSSLEDAATKFGLTVKSIDTTDARGRTPAGTPTTGLPEMVKFLPVAFASRKGEESPVSEADDGSFFVLRVDEVIAARTPDLVEVKDLVLVAWMADEKRVRLAKQIDELVNKINTGTALAGVARPFALTPKTAKPVKRDAEDPDNNLTAPLVAKMFALKQGFAGFIEVEKGFVIGRVKEIQAADPAKDADAAGKLTTVLRQALQNEVLIEFEQAVRRRYGVVIDTAALTAAFAPEPR